LTDKLIKNHAFDSLFQKVKEEKERASRHKVESLLQRSRPDPTTAAAAPRALGQQQSSPIEALFCTHARRSFLAFEDFYQDLKAGMAAKLQESFKVCAVKLDHLSSRLALPVPFSQILLSSPELLHTAVHAEWCGNNDNGDEKDEAKCHGSQGVLDSQRLDRNVGAVAQATEDELLDLVLDAERKACRENRLDKMTDDDEDGSAAAASLGEDQTLLRTSLREAKQLVVAHNSSVNEIKAYFDQSVNLLLQSYDQYMSSIAPSPFLVPLKCSVRCPEKNIAFDLSLLSTDDIVLTIKEKLRQTMQAAGNPVVCLDSDLKVFAQQRLIPLQLAVSASANNPANSSGDGCCRSAGPNGASGLIEKDAQVEVVPGVCPASLKLEPGCQFLIYGGIHLQSDERPKCFTALYQKGANQRVDYYRCKSCNSNWICQACAEHCHKGHELMMFMANHMPSYGCCYCLRKKKCVIENKKTKPKS